MGEILLSCGQLVPKVGSQQDLSRSVGVHSMLEAYLMVPRPRMRKHDPSGDGNLALPSGDGLPSVAYPLVMTNIAIENCHL